MIYNCVVILIRDCTEYQLLTLTDTEYFYTKCKKKTAGDQIDSHISPPQYAEASLYSESDIVKKSSSFHWSVSNVGLFIGS